MHGRIRGRLKVVIAGVLRTAATLILASTGVGVQVVPAPQSGRVELQVSFSKLLAVFDFLRQVSPRARDNPLKTLFANSAYANGRLGTLAAAIDSIPLDYQFPFSQYPKGLKIEGSTLSLLSRNLVAASSPTDFRLRSIGIIPMADLNRLVALLDEFTPVYDTLVYEPNRATFERQLREITSLIASKNVADDFEHSRAFFRASWDPAIPFVFIFHPLPNARGFRATAYGNIGEWPLSTSLTEYGTMLTLLLHETAHILLDEQPLDFKRELSGWFDASPARSAGYARALIQEAWSTAVGNGYFREKLMGSLSTGSWYGLKYPDQMAKAFYPYVKPYLEAGRPMDKALVDAYLNLFETQFIGWLSEWEHLLMGRMVLAERQSDIDAIDRKYPFRADGLDLREFSPATLRQVRESSMTKVIVVARDNRRTLDLVRAELPELAKWRPSAGRDFVYSVLGDDKQRLIVINLVKDAIDRHLGAELGRP